MTKDTNTQDTDFVKNDLLAKIKESKKSNKSGYEIDEKKIEEFARSCWDLLTEEEKNNYKEQKDKDSTNPPKLSKLAFDINRALQSAYSAKGDDIDDKLKRQVTNFKYLNLSNSALPSEKNKNEHLLGNDHFTEKLGRLRRNEAANKVLIGNILIPLATFPSIERLGHKSEDADQIIDITTRILRKMTKDSTLLKNGVLDPNITSAVAITVIENFDKQLKEKDKYLINNLAKAFKNSCSSLEPRATLEDVCGKLNTVISNTEEWQTKSVAQFIQEKAEKLYTRVTSSFRRTPQETTEKGTNQL